MRTIVTVIVGIALAVLLAGPTQGAWDFKRLTNNDGDSETPRISNSGSNLHVVWEDNSFGGVDEVFYKRSLDYGTSWSFQRLTNNSGSSINPAVAADGTTVHVVWYDTTFIPLEILYKRSTNNGTSWSYQRLTDNLGNSYAPEIVVDGTTVHVVWYDGTYETNEIFYKRSTNNGSSWSFRRLTTNAGESINPDVAASSSGIHVVWEDDTYGNDEIFYKRSTDNGSTWSFQRLSNNAGGSHRPSVSTDSDTVHVVWYDKTYGAYPEIFYKRSTDNGSTWSFQRLTTNSGNSIVPRIAAVGGIVNVVWQDDSYGVPSEIFFKQSTNSGSSWTFQRLTNNSGNSAYPALVYCSGPVAAMVVWEDRSFASNYEIFFKRGP